MQANIQIRAAIDSPQQHVAILPDALRLKEIARQLVEMTRKALSKKQQETPQIISQLKTVIDNLPLQKIYDAYAAVCGKDIPRYLNGDSGDIAVPLKQAMLDYLDGYPAKQQ